MARSSFFVSALTTGLVLAASSPIASATSPQPATTSSPQAAEANMLDMAMCGEREAVLAELAQQFKEEPMAVGQVDGNAVVEILVSHSGSWTILATGTDGLSCIVSAGEGFESTTLVRGLDV